QAFQEAVRAFGKALAAAKSKLQKFIGDFKPQYPAVAGLQAVIDAALEAGKDKFVEKATGCSEQITDDLKQSLGGAVRCVVDASKAAFTAGASAGAKQALREAIAAFGAGLTAAKGKLQKFIETFEAQYPAVSGLQSVLSAATDAGKK